MKKLLLIFLIVVCLVGVAVPIYAQGDVTLKGLLEKVEAIVELLTLMSDRLTAYEARLAVLEATDTPTPTPTASPTATPTPTASPTPTATPTPDAATVTILGRMNVRAGPGANYPIVGQALAGSQYPISGRNPAGSWWQIIYGGQYAWVYSPLVTATNPHLVQPASFIPTPPPTPIPPTAIPPPPPAQADPCAGIGGDGCKFRLRNRDFRHNGGDELKLYVGFVHEGRNDEVQGIGGSYYVELHKDGAHVSAFDHTTRGGNNTHNGPQGNKYNYLKIVSRSQVPGGSVNGNYTIWVKDGNGERDSQNFAFTVSGDQGEVWLIFAQSN